jgi:cytochrome c553
MPVRLRSAAILAMTATVNVVASPALAADAAAGKQKALATCTVCHGIDGIAKVPDAPNLAGESAIYTTRQLNAFKNGERQHEQMSIIAQGLSDEDIADLAAWYASVKISVELLSKNVVVNRLIKLSKFLN